MTIPTVCGSLTVSAEHSVTRWLHQLKAGDPVAAQPLWERYFRQLVHLARSRLNGVPRGMADEEDVALSAFNSLCEGIAKGRFPQLTDREDLWKLLVVLTARKAGALRAHEARLKRGGQGREVSGEVDWDGVVGDEPTPEFALEVAEQYRVLLDRLQDESLQRVAVYKLEGHTNEEIAAELGCSLRTVERKLHVIRSIWHADEPS